ncbi:GNAT family N-acetyltransferase [Pelagicoccus albus]|uniref:GNAT family N-acetyltransferase n=1 Tax=Pelagicoccus albus TaxID=415222 RepID=A0A7X1B801_9BACT|nr:GNAT family N-acetyltransferase [Pelagicoccus albus]MBC2607373.1 GNAT family N-acetyltransferase [Pelagicoccus albus]
MENILLTRKRPPSIIETENLLLRTPRIEDAIALHDLAAADEAFANATVGQNSSSLETACTAIVRMLEDHRTGTGAWWIVAQKDTGRVIGLTGFNAQHVEHGPMNVLAKDFHKKGLVREVIEGLILCSSPLPYQSTSFHSRSTNDEAETDLTPPTRWYWHNGPSRRCRTGILRCA